MQNRLRAGMLSLLSETLRAMMLLLQGNGRQATRQRKMLRALSFYLQPKAYGLLPEVVGFFGQPEWLGEKYKFELMFGMTPNILIQRL